MRNVFDNPLLLIVLLLIVVLVFGSKRLPEAARSIARSMRIFKTEVKEMREDESAAHRGLSEGMRPLERRVADDARVSAPGGEIDATRGESHGSDGLRRGVGAA